MSGPPSRDSSPPPMGRYSGMESRGGGGSRGGWYEEFRRYPPSAWDSRYGMPPDSFFASIDDLMSRRRKESMRSQEFELTRMLKVCKYADDFVKVNFYLPKYCLS